MMASIPLIDTKYLLARPGYDARVALLLCIHATSKLVCGLAISREKSRIIDESGLLV